MPGQTIFLFTILKSVVYIYERKDGAMKEKRLVGISLYIMFLPIIVFLIIKLIFLLHNFHCVSSPAYPFRFLYDYSVFGGSWRTTWERVSLYILLGMWVSFFSNAARLGAIVLTGATTLWGIMELIAIVSSISPATYSYVIKVYGLDDVILLAFIQTLFIIANLFVVFYLTRPKVKAIFK